MCCTSWEFKHNCYLWRSIYYLITTTSFHHTEEYYKGFPILLIRTFLPLYLHSFLQPLSMLPFFVFNVVQSVIFTILSSLDRFSSFFLMHSNLWITLSILLVLLSLYPDKRPRCFFFQYISVCFDLIQLFLSLHLIHSYESTVSPHNFRFSCTNFTSVLFIN